MKTLELEKNYRPEQVESKWYNIWEERNLFKADPDTGKEPFCIVIPPPNITGALHMGHALNNTIQDALIRYKRMKGFASLWIPGTDHAGIATQRVVEKELAKEGTDRWTIGREAFVERVWEWSREYKRRIINQLKRMGCSCDWSRERFTLDEGCSKAVREAFVQLYEKGWIYRGKRIINWCPHCSTALSDLEVEHEDKKGKLYHLRYPTKDGRGGITIATTRPETILADTAVAVNPEDPRYKEMIGRIVILPIVGRELPVIADDYVDMDFGTGALKITPAHDANDFEVGARHGLPSIEVIDHKGYMTEEAGVYHGQERFECRKNIVKDLETAGNMEKIDDYDMAVGTCYRCHTVIEPYLSEQWFVKTAELAKPSIQVVREGRVKFHPQRFANSFLAWMENLKDWCISRQLWWGHRIPIWKCADCGFENAFKSDPEICPECNSPNFIQDDYVLDTWFSSGLWPFSTMGWPDRTKDLEYFYPTSVLSTARDIINLWVARMIMFGLEFMQDIPFHDVFIHATVMNSEGRRMSKSLGTGVDPLDLFDKFGTDATRFGLAVMMEQGQDIKFSEERMEMSRNFANKIWNASRYVLRSIRTSHLGGTSEHMQLRIWDRWILSRLNATIKTVTENYDNFELDAAAKSLYMFFWDNFCDWYIEITKPVLAEGSPEDRDRAFRVLERVLTDFFRLVHPLMPFITEEIWGMLPANREKEEGDNILMASPWPEVDESLIDPESEMEFELVMNVVRALRNMRAEVNLTPRDTADFIIETAGGKDLEILKNGKDVITLLAGAGGLDISVKSDRIHKKSLSARTGEIDMYMPLEGLVDIETELNRLNKEKEQMDKYIGSLEKKCGNPGFLRKADPAVVEKEKAKLAEAKEKMTKIEERLNLWKE